MVQMTIADFCRSDNPFLMEILLKKISVYLREMKIFPYLIIVQVLRFMSQNQ